MDFSRLFDILPYQLKTFPQDDILCYKEGEAGKKAWRKYTSQEFVDRVNEISKALINYGIQAGDKIAIVSNNRPEWDFVDFGMMQAGAISVPVYPTISEHEYTYIFNEAEVKMAFVSDEEMFLKVKSIQKDVPTMKEIFSFEKIPGAKHLIDLVSLGKDQSLEEVEQRKNQIKPDDLVTIIYTSGTTGLPKGVMLSHRNLIANIKSVIPVIPINQTHRTLSFLPKCHVFERMVNYTYFALGASTYYAESIDTLGVDLKDVKPHYFTTVPRLLEKVYDKIVATGREQKGIKKFLFFWALNLGLKYDPEINLGWWYNLQLSVANGLVFSKWRAALGGVVEGIVVGAAALQPRLCRVFNAAGIQVREGYGQTEASPVIAFNRFKPYRTKIGTVGTAIPGVEIKLAGDGEVLARGENIMMGYFKHPDLTATTIDKDGWLHTGDVGVFDADNFLKITDRIKELFKTSGGKYVAPQVVENKMKESPFIEQIMIIGENQKFVAALIVPALGALKEWCQKHGIAATNNQQLYTNTEVQKLYQSEIDKFNHELGHIEQVKKFALIPEEWSVATGELTPTMKVKRKIILEKYKDIIAAIYGP